MKHHIRTRRIIVLIITIITSVVFFIVVSKSHNSDNARFRQIGVQIEYQWYSLTHKKIIQEQTKTFAKAQGVPVLVYHGITSSADRFSMTQTQFTHQLFALKQAGYQTITPDELISFLKDKQPLPEKSFLLTFDDGRKDSYYGADPVLRFLGYKAVMFIATHQSLDKDRPSYYLSPDELKNMLGTGRWFIESHARQDDGGFIPIDEKGTQANFLSNLKWLTDLGRQETIDEYKQRITDELVGSKQEIEAMFDVSVDLFSYPFGDYGYQSKNFKESTAIIHDIVSNDYAGAFHQIWPSDYGYLYNRQQEDPALLKRLEPSPTWDGVTLVKTLERSSPKALPFADTFSDDLGWKRSWGTVDISTGKKRLLLSGEANNSGAFSYLDGSAPWTNYLATMYAQVTHNSDLSIAARFVDQDNYVDCFFSNGTVTIRNKHDGELKKAVDAPNKYVIDTTDMTMGIAVNGNIVACLLNGHEVVRASIATGRLASDGGIGIGMWSNDKEATVAVNEVRVVPITSTLENTVSALPVRNLAIVAGETKYQTDQGLPKAFPAYNQKVLDDVFSTTASHDFVPNIQSANLVSNTGFTEVADGVPVGWKKNLYGNTQATLSYSQNDGLTTDVTSISNEGQAGWYFEYIPVVPGEEYVISGEYKGTAPVLFTAEYYMQNGRYQQDRMNWLVPTTTWTKAQGTIRVPEGAKWMTAYFMLETKGAVSIRNVIVHKLADGAFAKGMISLNFDDGFATSFTDVFSALQKRNITATHYIISDYIGYSRYMNKNQLKDLTTAGHEIGAHTTKHPRLTLLSATDLVHEIVTSKKVLSGLGFTVRTFDYPYGSVNNFVRAEVIKAGYSGARSTLRGFNTKNTDPFLLRDQHIDSDTTFAEIQSYIDKALTEKTWLVLEFHDTISGDKNVGEAINPKLLTQILEYIKSSGIQSVTMQEGLALMK